MYFNIMAQCLVGGICVSVSSSINVRVVVHFIPIIISLLRYYYYSTAASN